MPPDYKSEYEREGFLDTEFSAPLADDEEVAAGSLPEAVSTAPAKEECREIDTFEVELLEWVRTTMRQLPPMFALKSVEARLSEAKARRDL